MINSSTASAEPITEASSSFTNFILAQLHCAALRSKIITNQIETARAALASGLITAETAILILAETGLADVNIPSSGAA